MNIRALTLPLILVALAGACGGDDSTETASTDTTANTAPSEPAAAEDTAPPEPGGELHVDYGFIGFDDADVTLGTALAYVDDDSLRIDLVSDQIQGVECGHRFSLGREIEDGQLVVSVDTHGMSYSAPFDGQPGTYEHVGYTYYYRRSGFDHGTNSGNSARDDLDTTLTIDRIDDDVVQGSIRLRDQVTGTFVARVCSDE